MAIELCSMHRGVGGLLGSSWDAWHQTTTFLARNKPSENAKRKCAARRIVRTTDAPCQCPAQSPVIDLILYPNLTLAQAPA